MNTRFVVTSKAWFGGGADLTPMLDARRAPRRSRRADVSRGDAAPPARATQASLRTSDSRRGATNISSCPHRGEPRGIGGIFYDDLDAGDAETGVRRRPSPSAATSARPFFALRAIVRRNFAAPWSEAEREEQLVRRGRYVEFNLLYDRGTIFGLKTGGNVAAILSSMPPLARWP